MSAKEEPSTIGNSAGQPSRLPARFLGLSPVAGGTACCAVSALCYSASNICMRQLASMDAAPTWVACNKELVTVVVIGPWLAYLAFRGRPVLPSRRALVSLIVVGLGVQLLGNLGVQWALGVVGLAVVVTAIFGVMLTAGAVMGRVLLKERVSPRSIAAIGIVLVGLVFLCMGSWAVGKTISSDATPMYIALGVGASCLAGAIYATLTVTIRHAVTGTTRLTSIVFIITFIGVISLGPISVYLEGIPALLATPVEQFCWMGAAGVFNLIGFLAITKGLELTTVVHANVLNASQVAMAAVAGIFLFGEPPSLWLVLGVAATILGIVLIDRPKDDRDIADQHA
jgi:DME family drug/metabolite transporter